MFVIHLKGQNLKKTFTLNSSNKNDFLKKIWRYTFFLLNLWAKYEPIWTDLTAQTATLGANLLVKAQIIPQSAKCAVFCIKSCVY